MKHNSASLAIHHNLGSEKWNFKSEMPKCVVDTPICSLIFFLSDCAVLGN